jgi:hypothetical protein
VSAVIVSISVKSVPFTPVKERLGLAKEPENRESFELGVSVSENAAVPVKVSACAAIGSTKADIRTRERSERCIKKNLREIFLEFRECGVIGQRERKRYEMGKFIPFNSLH